MRLRFRESVTNIILPFLNTDHENINSLFVHRSIIYSPKCRS
ncbi:hypothetical protein JCM19294_1030 [Nonlabens tegetincola]|uniref:Uncharacterized protein n=1 Tax=Nonlabens tegetincola TaxID=323273 RepID=A0A090QMF2_9FLAO|nr:hypothetical protein JCM19294_1030 [Nonlabens tegetincola]